MGSRQVDECDIFKTLQPKGLRKVHVKVWVEAQTDGAIDTVLVSNSVEAGDRGIARVVRIAENATKPYARPQPAEGTGDAS